MVTPSGPLAIEELATILPPAGALVGLDLGTKTIGIATSDPGRRIATPLSVVRRTKFTADAREMMERIA